MPAMYLLGACVADCFEGHLMGIPFGNGQLGSLIAILQLLRASPFANWKMGVPLQEGDPLLSSKASFERRESWNTSGLVAEELRC